MFFVGCGHNLRAVCHGARTVIDLTKELMCQISKTAVCFNGYSEKAKQDCNPALRRECPMLMPVFISRNTVKYNLCTI